MVEAVRRGVCVFGGLVVMSERRERPVCGWEEGKAKGTEVRKTDLYATKTIPLSATSA